MAVSTGTGRYPIKTGEEKKDHSHGDTGSDGNRLGFSTVLFVEGSTGNTSVYGAASDCSSSYVSGSTCQDLLAIIQLVIITECKSIFCKKCFGHNDDSDHETTSCGLGESIFPNPGSPGKEDHVPQTGEVPHLFHPHEKQRWRKPPRAMITIAMGNLAQAF